MNQFRHRKASKIKEFDSKTDEKDQANTKEKSKIVDSEFVSDTFQTTEKDLEEVKAGMKMLGIDTLTNQTALSSTNGKRRLRKFSFVISSDLKLR